MIGPIGRSQNRCFFDFHNALGAEVCLRSLTSTLVYANSTSWGSALRLIGHQGSYKKFGCYFHPCFIEVLRSALDGCDSTLNAYVLGSNFTAL